MLRERESILLQVWYQMAGYHQVNPWQMRCCPDRWMYFDNTIHANIDACTTQNEHNPVFPRVYSYVCIFSCVSCAVGSLLVPYQHAVPHPFMAVSTGIRAAHKRYAHPTSTFNTPIVNREMITDTLSTSIRLCCPMCSIWRCFHLFVGPCPCPCPFVSPPNKHPQMPQQQQTTTNHKDKDKDKDKKDTVCLTIHPIHHLRCSQYFLSWL